MPKRDGEDWGWHCSPPVRRRLKFSALGEWATTVQRPWGWCRPPQASTDTEPWLSCGTSSLLRDHCIGCVLSNHFRSFGGNDQVKTTLNNLFRIQSFHEGPVISGAGQGTSSLISGCIGWDPGSGSRSPKPHRAPGTPLSSLHVCSLAHHGGPAGRGGPPVILGKTLSPRPGERARRENISAKRITSWTVAESKCPAKGGFCVTGSP